MQTVDPSSFLSSIYANSLFSLLLVFLCPFYLHYSLRVSNSPGNLSSFCVSEIILTDYNCPFCFKIQYSILFETSLWLSHSFYGIPSTLPLKPHLYSLLAFQHSRDCISIYILEGIFTILMRFRTFTR